MNHTTSHPTAAIEADARVPAISITRDFTATPEQLLKAHTDSDLFARWVGPRGMGVRIDHWDCRTLGSYRYGTVHDGEEYWFRGTFPEVGPDRIVQTFCFEGYPDQIALETMRFEDLGDGRTRLHAFSLCDSFEARDAMLRSGMDAGVNDGYAKLDELLSSGALA